MTTNSNEKTATPATVTKKTDGGDPWRAIVRGAKVLAKSHDVGDDGYYLANVEGVSADGKTLTLKWFGYPKLPTFTAKRTAVGLLMVAK